MPVVLERSATVRARDGLSLHVRSARPSDAPRGTVVVVHGASDHGGRLRPLSTRLAARGWAVSAFDLRGHGLSDGPAVHVDDFDSYVADLRVVLERVSDPSRPTAVVGLSLGGLVAARAAQLPLGIDAAVLVSPLLAFGFDVPPALRAAGHVVARFRPRTKLWSPVDGPGHDGTERRFVTAGWFAAVERGLASVWRARSGVRCPVRLFQGGEDTVVAPEAAVRWADRVASPVSVRRIENVGHDLAGGETVAGLADEFDLWLREATAPTVRRAAA